VREEGAGEDVCSESGFPWGYNPGYNLSPMRIIRVPKRLRVPGLRDGLNKCRGPVLHDGKFRTLGLHHFTPGFHLARIGAFDRVSCQERIRVPGST